MVQASAEMIIRLLFGMTLFDLLAHYSSNRYHFVLHYSGGKASLET